MVELFAVLAFSVAFIFFMAVLAPIIERTSMKVSGASVDLRLPTLYTQRAMKRDIKAALSGGEYFNVVLNTGETYQNVRYDNVVQLDPEAFGAAKWHAVMKHADGRKLLVPLDSIRLIEGSLTDPA